MERNFDVVAFIFTINARVVLAKINFSNGSFYDHKYTTGQLILNTTICLHSNKQTNKLFNFYYISLLFLC